MKTGMYITQAQLRNVSNLVSGGKVLFLYGPRRVGKTTLIEHYTAKIKDKFLLVSGEDIVVRDYLESESVEKLKSFVGSNKLLIIDEAQHIKNVGLNLKLIVDHIPGIQIMATGSSSLSLSRETGAPLAGRQNTVRIYPLAQLEIAGVESVHERRGNLEVRIIYGSYPEVVLINDNEKRKLYLRELISSYLFKDILEMEGIRKSDKLLKLLQLIAFQVGKEVSIAELGVQLGMSKNTVDRYLDLLEKSFVIFKRSGFSRNLRKEVSKSCRYYFVDTGIRNAVINNFNPLSLRDDVGALWENYIITERMKRNEYVGQSMDSYFWRTYDQKEIDLVEERDGSLYGYEVKWGKKKINPPKGWTASYPGAGFEIINPDNYLKFIM